MKVIVFEGIDGSGKNTQSKLLTEALRNMGYRVVHQDFHRYQTPVGALILQGLKGEIDISSEALHMLMDVDKRDFMRDMFLHEGAGVDFLVLDRWVLSNQAFAAANGMDVDLIRSFQKGLRQADITFLLDIPSGKSFDRRPERRDNFEKNSDLLFYARMHYKLLMDDLIASDELAVVVDGTQTVDEIHEEVLAHIQLALLTPELVDQVSEDSVEVIFDKQ